MLEPTAIVLGIAALIGVYVYSRVEPDLLEQTLRGDRVVLYGTLASVFAALLGFSVTALSIFSGSVTHPRLGQIGGTGYASQIRRLFVLAITTSGLGTLAALAALLFDREASPNSGLLAIVFALGVSTATAIACCVWVLNKLIEMLTHAPEDRAPTSET